MTNTSHRVILTAVGITAIAAAAIALMPDAPAPEASEPVEVEVVDTIDVQISSLIEMIQNGEGQPMMNIMALRDLANQYPEHHKAQLWMGIFSAQTGQWNKAVARFEAAYQAEPSHEETVLHLAEALHNVDGGDQANDILKEFVNTYPESSDHAQELLDKFLNSYAEATTLDSNSLIVSH